MVLPYKYLHTQQPTHVARPAVVRREQVPFVVASARTFTETVSWGKMRTPLDEVLAQWIMVATPKTLHTGSSAGYQNPHDDAASSWKKHVRLIPGNGVRFRKHSPSSSPRCVQLPRQVSQPRLRGTLLLMRGATRSTEGAPIGRQLASRTSIEFLRPLLVNRATIGCAVEPSEP
ncbi:hypothetical protein VTI28DRAFT_8184 [Corynascus sepedonium]